MTYALEGVGLVLTVDAVPFGADVIELTAPESAREALETTHLGTLIAKTFKAAKLRDPGEWAVVFDYDPAVPYLNDGVARTFEIELPLESGQLTPFKIAWTGFVTSDGGGAYKVDELNRINVTIKQSGAETITPAT